jgi:two-component system LytT family response regulator
MKTYNCIIVDDEPKAIELLSDCLVQVNKRIKVEETCTSWTKALQCIRDNNYDLIFLDISIHGRSGLDLLRCAGNVKSEIIFTTAFEQHALEAFEFFASGYLLKPISEIELAAAVDRAIIRCQNKTDLTAPASILQNKIGIATSNSIAYVNVDEIIYLEAVNSYTKVYTEDKQILSSYNLGRFKQILDRLPFIQVHRSYIINGNKVKEYKQQGSILMSSNNEVPISKSYRDHFLQLFHVISGHIR